MGEKRQRCSEAFRQLLGRVSIVALLIVIGGRVGSVNAEDPALDRLFYTSEERVILEILRESASHPPLPAVESEQGKVEAAREKPQTFTLGGTVTGKGGVQAVWLNGRQYPQADLPVHVKVQKPYSSGQVVLRVEEKGKTYSLRSGQTLYLGEDRIREPYERPPAAATSTPAATTEAVGEPVGNSPEKP